MQSETSLKKTQSYPLKRSRINGVSKVSSASIRSYTRRTNMKIVHRCLVCNHKIKRRKNIKAGMGPTCARHLQEGFAGIQIPAFEEAKHGAAPWEREGLRSCEVAQIPLFEVWSQV